MSVSSILRIVAFSICQGAAWCQPVTAAPLIRFAAEDWPPFISKQSPSEGLSGAVVSAVFERIGYQVIFNYFPWKRVIESGLGDARYAGFLPVWRNREREQLCHFSVPLSSSQLVLAYLKDQPLRASSVPDLKNMKIGTVSGYANDEQFDELAARGGLTVEPGVSDAMNLKKLLLKRFRAIVIERRVLQHLMETDITKLERERIAVNDAVFKQRPLHVCFKRNAEGLALQKQFNDAAREVDIVRLERDYWQQLGQSAEPLSAH
ncbi:substrate-binding periplasmic protein [Janthinobacterium agaricidamnosum]|uniref:Solute-binding protein family 3/N-terminal domain-containing protein n=1 Tax=Janthinobacterium agaricidamnosum NBRC 102515 = DSM 9628 TaxID=1349767 RepID=W0VBJ9_9BURK|nr:transporter substrate-binding domain-containing protein [Janthinobacterium agaricidamnosum]CDG84970.1 hypothetical protein GJA_4362 [Janthinobacterium agaricidamnosum NBRC 102515 = DSM 9628]